MIFSKGAKLLTTGLILILMAYSFLPGMESPALANQLGTELELTLGPAASVTGPAVGG